jgi:hypothetical protein
VLPYTIDTTATKLTAAAMSAARDLKFSPYYSQPGVDALAEVSGYLTPTGTLFKVNLIAGGLYDILSLSTLDPKEMTFYDQFGNVLGVNGEANDPNPLVIDGTTYDIDAAYGIQAPYTGTYYIEAGWRQGTPNSSYLLDVVARLSATLKMNAPQAKAAPTSIQWTEGSPFTYNLPANAFTDADANAKLSYFAVLKTGDDLPSWLKLDSVTGAFTGVAPTGSPDIDIVLFARDETGLASSGSPIRITTPSAPVDTLSVLTAAYTNILRTAPSADNTAFKQLVADVSSGKSTMNAGVSAILYAADYTTSVASLSYQFFTGKIPGQAGMDYLVSPTGPNANNLNSAYYQSFNLENRYINFAMNLGKYGEGKDTFAATYGSLSLFDATREAYKTIFGRAPSDEKIHALIDTRVDYFAVYGGDGPNGIGTKAAMAGWLLAEAVKADVGMYARSNDAFLFDLADGANFAVSLVGVYGKELYVYG